MSYKLRGDGYVLFSQPDGGVAQIAPNGLGWSAYQKFLSDGGTVAAADPPLPNQILTTTLAAGISITSTGNQLLNGTYALDQTSQAQLFQIGSFAKTFGFFPSGAGTQDYPDITGTPHTFTPTQFVNLLLACAAFVSAAQTTAAILTAGGAANWPSASATIG